MPVSVKIGGTWKTATAVFNKVGGAWKTASDMPVKIAGAWKTGILAQGAFESIATVIPTGTGTVTFSSISSTYKHLQIRYSCASTATFASGINGYIQFNSDTAANYSQHALYGNGTSATANGSASTSNIQVINMAGGYIFDNTSSFIPAIGIIDIIDYASTSKNKTVRLFTGFDKNGAGNIAITSGLWRSTSAINSITFAMGSTFAGATVALYGIKG